MAFSVVAPTRTPKSAVEMTQLYQDRLSVDRHSSCVVDGLHIRHTGYGDTDHPDNDSPLSHGAVLLPYAWDCQSSIETLCGKHGGFNVGYRRRHEVEYGCPVHAARDPANKQADVPRRM